MRSFLELAYNMLEQQPSCNNYYYSGVPVMRPLWYEFPNDEGSFGREGIHMIGDALLVAPILKKSATECKFYRF